MEVKEKGSFLSIVLGTYVLLIGIGLPIVVRDRYFDILLTKYYYYCACTILMVFMLLMYSITIGKKNIFIYLKKSSGKAIMKRMMPSDYFVLIFLLTSIISVITSDYLYESFWGNEGRFTGLFLIIWYVASYFCISRFWKYNKIYIDLILGTGILVCLFGITDYFQMDIFRFKVAMIEGQKSIFTSTLGNINTYTAYVGMIMAISTVLFATVKTGRRVIFYYLCMVISFFAIIMGVSDNAYLSLVALFGFLPLYLFSEKRGIQRYLTILATFFSVIQTIDWVNFYFKDTVLGIDSVFNVIIGLEVVPYLLVILWGMNALWYIVDYIRKSEYNVYGNKFRYIWLILILIILFFTLYALYDCNVLGNTARYGKVGIYLIFDDNWGTHRGYIWRNVLEQFDGLNMWNKLVGTGPETIGILLMHKTYGNPYNEIFDSAHNEYLQLLLTVGIIGLTSYAMFIYACIKRFFSYKINDSHIAAIAFGVICYSIQAFVNLNLPIVTPIVWLLLGIGSARSIES